MWFAYVHEEQLTTSLSAIWPEKATQKIRTEGTEYLGGTRIREGGGEAGEEAELAAELAAVAGKCWFWRL
jgi:hypothetical protein